MRLPWGRRGVSTGEADEAQQQAQRARLDAENFDRRTEELVQRLSETRKRNHFAEAVMAAIIRGAQ